MALHGVFFWFCNNEDKRRIISSPFLFFFFQHHSSNFLLSSLYISHGGDVNTSVKLPSSRGGGGPLSDRSVVRRGWHERWYRSKNSWFCQWFSNGNRIFPISNFGISLARIWFSVHLSPGIVLFLIGNDIINAIKFRKCCFCFNNLG